MVFTLMAGCTVKNSTTAEAPVGPKSCYDFTNLEECARDGECTARYGHDALTAEDIFVACMPFYHPNRDCYGEESCYTNSAGQRAIASRCDYPRWTEVACTAKELAPCEYSTATACEADKRCTLNMAKDLATKDYIPMGCGYIKGICGDAFTCYANKLTGARVMASSVCRTPFPEWEYTDCTDADYQASKIP
jgi:hypothetical protein